MKELMTSALLHVDRALANLEEADRTCKKEDMLIVRAMVNELIDLKTGLETFIKKEK